MNQVYEIANTTNSLNCSQHTNQHPNKLSSLPPPHPAPQAHSYQNEFLGYAFGSSQSIPYKSLAASISSSQYKTPVVGLINYAGKAPGNDYTYSILCIVSALPPPATTNATHLPELSTGNVSVMRSGGGLGLLSMGTTQLLVSCDS